MALVLALAGLSGTAAPVGAADVVDGFTWYGDGTYVKAGPAGTVITAYATQARPNSHYYLVADRIVPDRNPCRRSTSVRLNPTIRASSGSGFIGNTSGAVNLPPDTYWICFIEAYTYGDSGTAPVFFTVG